jgi:tetratricopeptide (TPR) repeat protein
MSLRLGRGESGDGTRGGRKSDWATLWQIPLLGTALVAWGVFVVLAIGHAAKRAGDAGREVAQRENAQGRSAQSLGTWREEVGEASIESAEARGKFEISAASLCDEGSVLRVSAEGLLAQGAEFRSRGLEVEAGEREEAARRTFGRAARLFMGVVRDVGSDRELHRRGIEQACDCLDASRDYARAAVYYRLLLKCTSRADELAATRLRYARTLQALGEQRAALLEIDQCVGSSGNAPVAYEAMLARSESCIAAGDWEGAEKALRGIVSREDALSPWGRTWGEALAKLGYVLYREAKFAEAAEKLEEALTRDVGDERGNWSRLAMKYYLAESYRNIGSVEAARRKAELAAAAKWYAEVHKGVEGGRTLSVMEQRMARRSRVAEADCRCELGEYEAALGLYGEAAERLLETAEGVAALFGVASCRHELGDAEGAIEALNHAEWGLERLKRNDPGQVPAFLEECWGAMTAWSIGGEGS